MKELKITLRKILDEIELLKEENKILKQRLELCEQREPKQFKVVWKFTSGDEVTYEEEIYTMR